MSLSVSTSLRRGKTPFAALLIAVVLLTSIQLGSATQAAADVVVPDAVVGFCGNVALGPLPGGSGQTWCQAGGVYGGLYQAYAWGEHSVCVEIQPWTNTRACSTGTNGVYSGLTPAGLEYGFPTIQNNTATVNHASGIYLTH